MESVDQPVLGKYMSKDDALKYLSSKALFKYYSEHDPKTDPEYNIVDIFLHVDVKSDKTVNKEEMKDFIKFLQKIDL